MSKLSYGEKVNLLELLREKEKRSCQKDIGAFIRSAWDVLEPATELRWNWHHDVICEYLEAVRITEITRLIINVPPRSMKSIMGTICFPAWIWIKDPSARFLFGSYSDTLSRKHSIMRRELIQSEWYQNHWKDKFKMREDQNTQSDYANSKSGVMRSASLTAGPLGEGGDYIIIDDPQNPRQAYSEAEREASINAFDRTWSTRLNDKKRGKIIIIMQRLHDKDLTGHLLAKNAKYEHLVLPAEATSERVVYLPVSKKGIVIEAGKILHPEREGREELDALKRDLGPIDYAGQYLQVPTPETGAMFKSEMFEFGTVPETCDYSFITADTAYNDKQENDYTVFAGWVVKDQQIYLKDILRGKIKAADVESQCVPFIRKFQQYGFRGAYIEPKAHGLFLNQNLPRLGLMIPSESQIKEFFSDRNKPKTERANNAIPYLSNRKVIINQNIHCKEELLKEVLSFPKGSHDDFTDCLIDATRYTYARKVSILDAL